MKKIHYVSELEAYFTNPFATRKTVGFVPTMGAIHKGHLDLIKEARNACDTVVVSVYVNPKQFNNPHDLETYPNTPDNDQALLSEAGCDVLFAPETADVYPAHFKPIELDLSPLDTSFEGAHREGHFNGVIQVLNRFFAALHPDFVVMGEKDYQQCLVVKKLLDAQFPKTRLIICPTSRMGSGLAYSSRNSRLSPEGLKKAADLYKSLVMARVLIKTQPVPSVIEQCRTFLDDKGFEVDYFDIVDRETMDPLDLYHEKKAIAIVAATIENVRLIDNLRF